MRAVRDLAVSIQYGFAAGADLIPHPDMTGVPRIGGSAAHQEVLDVGFIFHGAPNPSDDRSVDPGGGEVHLQFQVNEDQLNRGAASSQANLQGQIVTAAWLHCIQGSAFAQLSAGTGRDSQGQLGPMVGAAAGAQAGIFGKIGVFQAMFAIQIGVGVQDANGQLQAPAQAVATLTFQLDATPGH